MVHLVDVTLLAKEEPLQENYTECDSLCGFLRFEASTLSSESSNKGTESSEKTFRSFYCIGAARGCAARPPQSTRVIYCTCRLRGLNTCGVLQQDAVFRAVTHPLAAAAPRYLHQPRVRAARRLQILSAQRDARDAAAHTAAQLPARGSERLTLLVPHAQVFTAERVLPCRVNKRATSLTVINK